ncbi:3'(2'),5'-bisphosphate nucleotidase CysQ [Lacihabitans lacunae]|uniref:3'(2'),5'-bisphosphate nucleotidase CysQ n=1 Tax=Lacihabitans lacunae TaxID=1028214 RepID=A0ABV7YSZ9_9BACT
MTNTELLDIAIKASMDAGDAIMTIYNSDDFGIETKGDNSPLTKADLVAHKEIVAQLGITNIPVLSEEGKNIPYEERKNWEKLWIVDPIDGTKEFIKKNGEFTVNIALIENQIPILSVVFAPATGELYYAEKSIGSFKTLIIDGEDSLLDIKDKGQKLPIDAGRKNYTVVASKSHLSIETEDYIADLKKEHGEIEVISRGSSLKLCMVAEGLADCYPRFAPTMEWDTAAGQGICLYAGRQVLDWQTKDLILYNRENLLNNWFLVN